MKFSDYSVKDFVMDKYFQEWVINPNEDINLFWESWMTAHLEKVEEIKEARRIIQNTPVKKYDLSSEDFYKIWEKINLQTEEVRVPNVEAQVFELDPAKTRARSYSPVWRNSRLLLRVAAVFIGVLISASAYFLIIQGNTVKYMTEYGETKTIVLPDNSVVTLNANSQLKFSSDWLKEERGKDYSPARQVWLEGEAFFNVRKKPGSRSFIVHANQVKVQVLGTVFSVNNRRGNTKVVLNSGKVKLDINNRKREVYMDPGELVAYDESNGALVKKEVNPQIYSAWTKNKLVFNETSVSQIVQILEDNYGLIITIRDTSIADRKYTGTFNNPDSEVILASLSTLFNIKIERKGNHIILKNESPSGRVKK